MSRELPHVVRLPVLGVETTFATNSHAVREIIEETYGAWGALAGRRELVSPSTARVRILLVGGDGLPHPRDAPLLPAGAEGLGPGHHARDLERLVVVLEGGAGVADTRRLESTGHVTPALLARRAELVEKMLEPLTLFLLGTLDRQPLHASAVVREGVAVLLAGPSGVGKSTLAHAARLRGFVPLADEPVYVQLRPSVRVWGRRARLHLPVEARAHFPELAAVPAARLSSGKTKIVVHGDEDAERRFADRVGICLLRRDGGEGPRLRRISAERAADELSTRLEPGFDLYRSTIREAIAGIAERGAWHLDVGRRPQDAVSLLEEVARAVEAGG